MANAWPDCKVCTYCGRCELCGIATRTLPRNGGNAQRGYSCTRCGRMFRNGFSAQRAHQQGKARAI